MKTKGISGVSEEEEYEKCQSIRKLNYFIIQIFQMKVKVLGFMRVVSCPNIIFISSDQLKISMTVLIIFCISSE